ncbi:hypothetical protein JMJ77_0011391, partial [Colletotrichum scovillei]
MDYEQMMNRSVGISILWLSGYFLFRIGVRPHDSQSTRGCGGNTSGAVTMQ